MNTTVNIRLGKKDSQLIDWWEEMSKRDYNISKTIYLATLYYIYTGEYLTIANLKRNDKVKENASKKFYLQKETEVFEWLSEKQEQKYSVSQLIRGILKQSIKMTEDDIVLKEPESLVLLVEEARTKRKPQQIPNERVENTSSYRDTYRHSEPVAAQKNTFKQAEPPRQKKETIDYSAEVDTDYEVETDLFDVLGSGHKIVL